MVKHGNNPSGKSDKHQAHNMKYAATHRQAELERWYEKITTPKPEKPKIKKIKRVVSVNNTKVTAADLLRREQDRQCKIARANETRRERGIARINVYYMMKEDINIQ